MLVCGPVFKSAPLLPARGQATMHPNPSPEDGLVPGSSAHRDEMWELELAEIAHQREKAAHPEAHHGLQRHLLQLHQRYSSSTPSDLLIETLPDHAEALVRRYRHVLNHVKHLIHPPHTSTTRLKQHLRSHLDADVYYQSVTHWQRELIAEINESVRYWKWIDAHHRLPRDFAWWLGQFNHRPIAHPWQTVRPEELAGLAQIQIDVEL